MQRELNAKGLIYKGKHAGWYAVSDECFYTDKEVTKLPASSESSEDYYISTETRSRVEWTEEENYKFKLSAFKEKLREHFEQHPDGKSQYLNETAA